METLMNSIVIGIKNFPIFAVIFTLPILLGQLLGQKKINIVRIAMSYAFILYSLCLISVVFLPLPSMTQAANLCSHDIQFVPFHFVADIIKESPLEINNVRTYFQALTNKAVLQVVFNVLLTVPFGMFLRYRFHLNRKKIILCSFALCLLIEIAQLTGLFFIFKGSYRLCDVDDIMANTLGGFVGYTLVHMVEAHVPAIEKFDIPLVTRVGKRA